MGNVCSRRKGDTDSTNSQGSGGGKKRESLEGPGENHSGSGSKRPSAQNGVEEAAAAASAPKKAQPRQPEPSSISDSMSLSSPTATSAAPPSEFAYPEEVRKQSDNVRSLLSGRISKVKSSSRSKKITLYLSAACSEEFALEKGVLHGEVVPTLRSYASERGYEFHVVDLHWSGSLHDKQNHEFSELCIGELKRQLEVSYVIPVLLLSSSLGAPILPKTVEQADFEGALKQLGDNPEGKALLEKWYSLDKTAQPPCYQLAPIVKHLPAIESSKPEERAGAVKEWKAVVEEILLVQVSVFPVELRDTYLTTTVIEQEVHNSIFMSREVARRSIWVSRKFTHLQVPEGGIQTPLEAENQRRLEALQNELKAQLTQEHILRMLVKWKEGGLAAKHAEHSQYLSDLGTQVSTQLRSVIDEIIEEDTAKSPWKSCYGLEESLSLEVMRHTAICQQAAKCSLAIETPLNAMKAYLGSDKITPLIVHGPRGAGKSSLLSRAIQQCSSQPSWHPDALLVFRFAGATSQSRTLDQILRTITSQVALIATGRVRWTPHSVESYRAELFRIYSALPSPQPLLVVLIDGIDALEPKEEWAWLGEPLPGRLKLILSVCDDSPVFQTVKANASDATFLPVPPLSSSGADALVKASFLQFSHDSADSSAIKRLTAKTKLSTIPLFIKILSWGSAWPDSSWTEPDTINDARSAIGAFFDHLEKVLSKEKVISAMGLLLGSRTGLGDSEMLDILAKATSTSKASAVDWAPPNLFLAELVQRLGPLLERGPDLKIKDGAVAEVALKRYLAPPEEKKARQTLLDYFQAGAKAKELPGSRTLRRRLEEVPFQHSHLKGSIRAPFLTNLEWIVSKVAGSSVFLLLEEIDLELKRKKDDPELILLRRVLELSASALFYDGRQFLAQVAGRLGPLLEAPPHQGKNYPFLKALLTAATQGPSPSPTFVPLTPFLAHEEITKPVDDTIYFDDLTRMKSGNRFVVSLSSSTGVVKVWDTWESRVVRTIKGVANPIMSKMVDEFRVIILCGRELVTYNLDEGTCLGKMKGVMNQKMPYFGLSADHIVALSRNRMYVNLMNMDTGDCVTTFKVGEDRFLNSLIVSDNGKILVCGDETQKPFPLLVWDLTSRKLIYDLRIPHHEFITSLSAITKEGHFVACVCCEIEDPTPNFIVVYDLQSGTLFKKWKPASSTVAIAISSQGSCVISALEDNQILIWDLVTGACKWTLEKHNAPANVLRLNDQGTRCLSCDSNGRDRTICLWDLATGTLLGLFTPDLPFTAVEISNDGDHVILGQKGQSEVTTLRWLAKGSAKGDISPQVFGTPGNEGKVTDHTT